MCFNRLVFACLCEFVWFHVSWFHVHGFMVHYLTTKSANSYSLG
jgi:hypothetical protein